MSNAPRSSAAPKTIALYGNTYPVRDRLAKLGGRPRKDNGGKWYWEIPAAKEVEARALVGGKSGGGGGLAFTDFVPTPEQALLRDFILSSTHNLFIRAGAGCGKTTVSLWLLSMIAGSKLMVAFNSDIKIDIQEKAPKGVDVLTMNALGYRALCRAFDMKIKVDGNNLFEIFKARVGEATLRERYGFFAQVKKLIDLAKGALVVGDAEEEDVMAVEMIAQSFDLQFEDTEGADATSEAVALCLNVMNEQRLVGVPEAIDFTDQVWLPVVLNLPMPQYGTLVIDEAQDTNPLQLEMLSRCVAPGGRVIAVGDPMQAIYAWRGADCSAIEKIIARFAMQVLNLMTTFRCGKAIVAEAQAFVPDFKAGPNNHEGVVRSIRAGAFFNQVEAGDMVLSRTNAPLAAACLRLLRAGKPAAIVGRNGDLVSTLVKMVKKAKADSVAALESYLGEWLRKETEKIMRRLPINEAALDASTDKVDTILAFSADAEDVAEVIERIEKVFDDRDGGPGARRIDLSTVHKAKGRERDTVFMFDDTFMQSRKNRDGEWEAPSQEEENLCYVAITRAKRELVRVDGMKKLSKR